MHTLRSKVRQLVLQLRTFLSPSEGLVEHQGEPSWARVGDRHQLRGKDVLGCLLPPGGLKSDPRVRIQEDVLVALTGWSQVGVSVNHTGEDLTRHNTGAE